jgi:two-component system LytT family response regulator
MKTRALIVDDEPLARDVIRLMLRDYQQVEMVGECRNGAEAVSAIRSHRPDLVFLDVQMPDLDGFGVIKEIGVENMPVTIFVTAYDKYAIRAFDVHALDYLLKPFDRRRFEQTLTRALSQIDRMRNEDVHRHLLNWLEENTQSPKQYLSRFVIKESGRIFFINADEVDWVEAAGDYVSLHVGRKSHLLHERMNALEEKLDPQKFLRIHRSTIVNIERVQELQPHSNGEFFVLLTSGAHLKLSRSYREDLQKLLGHSI